MVIAIVRLAKGPARETIISSRRGWRKLKGSIGTGLAQPMVGMPVKMLIRGKIIVPKGSRWALGLRVSRPRDRGVGSPR